MTERVTGTNGVRDVRPHPSHGRTGKKKKSVAVAFDWPGWDRSAKTEAGALGVLATYRPRYAKVADRAGLADEFGRTGDPEVVERLEGIGMTDFYGLSGRPAGPEYEQMSEAA
ncbi:MAG: hypothetical protein ABJC39_08825 [Chloroflexota bacterium]